MQGQGQQKYTQQGPMHPSPVVADLFCPYKMQGHQQPVQQLPTSSMQPQIPVFHSSIGGGVAPELTVVTVVILSCW